MSFSYNIPCFGLVMPPIFSCFVQAPFKCSPLCNSAAPRKCYTTNETIGNLPCFISVQPSLITLYVKMRRLSQSVLIYARSQIFLNERTDFHEIWYEDHKIRDHSEVLFNLPTISALQKVYLVFLSGHQPLVN